MKKLKSYLIALALLGTAYLAGTSYANTSYEVQSDPPNETELLVQYLENNLKFISENTFPIINADEVKKNMNNEKYHLIDIRSDSWFEYGHIKGANNVKAEDLLNYFKSEIVPQSFEKVVLVCYSGQSTSYFASLLRIAGYDNVYSMKWGMSSWREDFAEDFWMKNAGEKDFAMLETTENIKPSEGNYPEINTGAKDVESILNARLEELFQYPYSSYVVKFDDAVASAQDFFIVNFTSKESYDLGHLQGAVNYIPGKSLLSSNDLKTLPSDKAVLICGETGLEAAFVVAYMNVLGYEANNLAYGVNGFMNKNLKRQNADAFSNKEINMYPVIE